MADSTPPLSGLRKRCQEMIRRQSMNAMLRQGDPVEDLLAFVLCEIGRGADERLDQSVPLCLYFTTEDDRREFIALVREAKPDMIMKEMP